MDPANRRRSSRGPSGEESARTSALERLKAIRQSGRSAAGVDFQVKMEEPIYDTIPEEAYASLVAKRREAAKDFIVDDNGLGYGDLGEEEDWENNPAYRGSSSEEDHNDDQRRGSRKKDGSKIRKRRDEQEQSNKRPSSLSAAAALMGKQRLSSMFTSSAFQRNAGKGVADDASIIDQVIAEITPDEADRERRRRRPGAVMNVTTQSPAPKISNHVPMSTGNSFAKHEQNHVSTTMGNSFSKHHPSDSVVELSVVDREMKMDVHTSDTTSNMKSQLHHYMKDSPAKVPKEDPDGTIENEQTHQSKSDEVKLDGTKREGLHINAKITVKTDPKSVATAGWELVRKGDNGNATISTEPKPESDKTSEFFLDSDGSLPFYILDAYEELHGENRGKLYLFGKVKVGDGYGSCCVIVNNMQRCIYAIPNENIFSEDVIMELEKNIGDSQSSPKVLRSKLQEMASPLKNELSKVFMDTNISTFSMTPVKRSYAFERTDVPKRQQYVVKVNYPFKDVALPSDIKGDHFTMLFGVNSSALELFLIKRRIKGPSWICISNFVSCSSPQRVSWCRYEVAVDSPKNVTISSSKAILETPPVIVASISLKTIVNEKKNANEIVSASVVCCCKAKIDVPMLTSEWNKAGVLTHCTIVRKLEGGIFPLGFTKEIVDRNSKSPFGLLVTESSERALLSRLMIEIHKSDCDVLVGHNISGFHIDVLLHRAQALNVMWSKIGRLKRSVMPKLTRGRSGFGSGASPGILSCIAGRLLCDTYLSSRELLKEASYSLTHLAKAQLGKDQREIPPQEIPLMFRSSNTLLELVEHGETDAWLSLGLMFHLSMLPLTRQLTNIAGNLWGKTLQGARAQRVEYLLLHAFHELKYILPDKASFTTKGTSMKRGVKHSIEDEHLDDKNIYEDNIGDADIAKHKKGPAYSGGLVLEPKKGLYDKYILLLDFNSLYPSIIQEYNICFTTVERTKDGSIPALPTSTITGVLPKLLHSLVDRRRKVKQWMKNTSDRLKIQQLDVQQQALKLTANSVYGCLGFSNSRFYAKQLAEIITLQGREILQSTVDLVRNQLNFEVIYGDTDSIMLYTGLDDISEAKAIATKVRVEVNKKYRCLEIDLDGLYKRMLLLKKKKYAAVKVQFSNDGSPYEVIERKGLDMVRRDWSLLSKELGDFCLGQILSGGSCEDVVESIHNRLLQVKDHMRNGEVELDKYVIMKTLTKSPEEYPDGKNQPHVQVALRMRKSGLSSGFCAGDTIPYIICCQQGLDSGSSSGIAQRARHPDELKHDDGGWMIDIDYYLSQQILPVVSRLCACIEGTGPARLADCLGLDTSKFQQKTFDVNKDQDRALVCIEDENERYHGCAPLWLTCPSCSTTFECPAISSFITASVSEKFGSELDKGSDNFWAKLHCPRCPEEDDQSKISPSMIANQVKRQAERFISSYYTGLMICDDELCEYTTRCLNLRVMGDSEKGTICTNYPRCHGHLVRRYTEVDLYKQLSYFCHVLDSSCWEKLEIRSRVRFEKQFARIRQAADLGASSIRKIRDRCAYGWVKIEELAIF